MYVCIYIYIETYMYLHTHMYVYALMYSYIHLSHLSLYISIYLSIYLSLSLYIYIYSVYTTHAHISWGFMWRKKPVLAMPTSSNAGVSEPPKRVVSGWVVSLDPSFALHIEQHV